MAGQNNTTSAVARVKTTPRQAAENRAKKEGTQVLVVTEDQMLHRWLHRCQPTRTLAKRYRMLRPDVETAIRRAVWRRFLPHLTPPIQLGPTGPGGAR